MFKKFILIVVGLVVIAGIFVLVNGGGSDNSSTTTDSSVVSEENGKQIIAIKVKDGYKPGNIQAKADKPTILRMTTSSTFDCSTSLTIPSLKIFKNLPQTGTTDLEIPAQKAGTDLKLSCSMNMYKGSVKFV